MKPYELADEVTALINAGGLGVTAERKYLAEIDFETLGTTVCYVVPSEVERVRITRAEVQKNITISVYIAAQGATNDMLDGYSDLLESIIEYLEDNSTSSNMTPITTTSNIMQDDTLNTRQQFYGILTAIYITV